MDAYIGEIRAFPITFIPQDWLPCDGRLYSIAEFSPLFSLLGNTYGGNGSTTFAVPDLRGRAGMQSGAGPLGTVEFGQQGGDDIRHATGSATLSFSTANLPGHTHAASFSAEVEARVEPQIAFKVSGDPATAGAAPSGGFLAANKAPGLAAPTSSYSSTATAGLTPLSDLTASASGGSGGGLTGGTVALGTTGGDSGATMAVTATAPVATPPYLAIGYGICHNGIWPSRP